MPQSSVLQAAEQEIQSLRETLRELHFEHKRQYEVQQSLERELKKSLKWEKLSKHLIQLMNRSFEPDIIIEIIVQELGIFFNVDRCLVLLFVNDSEGIEHLNLFAQYCRDETICPVTQDAIPWHALGASRGKFIQVIQLSIWPKPKKRIWKITISSPPLRLKLNIDE